MTTKSKRITSEQLQERANQLAKRGTVFAINMGAYYKRLRKMLNMYNREIEKMEKQLLIDIEGTTKSSNEYDAEMHRQIKDFRDTLQKKVKRNMEWLKCFCVGDKNE